MYLLGELPEDDLVRLEELLFADDAYYEQLLIVEDELRYDYAQGLLDPERRERFEKRLAASPDGRQTLAFAAAFGFALSAVSALPEPELEPAQAAPQLADAPPILDVPPILLEAPRQNTLSPRRLLAQTSRAIARFKPGSLRLPRIKVSTQPLPARVTELLLEPDTLHPSSPGPEGRADLLDRVARIAFAVLGIFLILGVAAVIMQTIRYQNQVRDLRRELGMQKGSWSQTEEEKSRAAELQHELEEERSRRLMLEEEATKRNKQTGQKPEPDPPAAASFVLSPGLTRDSGPMKKPLIQLGDADRVRLQLNLKAPGDFQSYQAFLKSAEGRLIWGQAGLRPGRFGSIHVLTLTLLSRLVPPGDFHVEVKGLATGRAAELVDDYYFSVAQR
jgi:Sec-independent protein translocase protein TatA